MADLAAQGWEKFPFEPALADWAAHANAEALRIEARPPADMLRCDGTWFVGVNALANDAAGRLGGGPPLRGTALDAASAIVGRPFDLDRGQASVCYPGYPRRGVEEDEAAFRYRRDRHAAHVDGLLRVMPGRRRRLEERHAFILGIPLNDAPAGAAPLIVWEGSHEIMRAAFQKVFFGTEPDHWAQIDVTDAYQKARRVCFAECEPVEVVASPGEAYVVHRLALHGVGAWENAAESGRRAIAYFRPDPGALGIEGHGADWWLNAP
jgi:hypothetical protein